MSVNKDSPGVYLPPPLIYVISFGASLLLQKGVPLPNAFFGTMPALLMAPVFIAPALTCILPAVLKFFKTKNTLVTIRPASSLCTTGIYSKTRNPMYLGLLGMYTGVAMIKGNLWTLLLIPVVILIVTKYVILSEERYLARAFGSDYDDYKNKVRRWI